MPVRTHAPECAKSRRFHETSEMLIDCTCGARYEPGALEAQQRRLTILAMRDADAAARVAMANVDELDRLRDDLNAARAAAAQMRERLGVEFGFVGEVEQMREFPLPWESSGS